MDRALAKVLQTNKLCQVTSISLYSGCFLSLDLLRKLIFDCEKLSSFSFSQSETLDLNDVERMRMEIAAKNLDIRLCCLEMFNIWDGSEYWLDLNNEAYQQINGVKWGFRYGPFKFGIYTERFWKLNYNGMLRHYLLCISCISTSLEITEKALKWTKKVEKWL